MDTIIVFVDDAKGQPNASQAAMAELIMSTLDERRQQASNYLDMFIDRGKACGDPAEPWFLDEVEMRGLAPLPVPRFQLNFTLAGDGDGLWQVEMILHGDQFTPVRFERSQG